MVPLVDTDVVPEVEPVAEGLPVTDSDAVGVPDTDRDLEREGSADAESDSDFVRLSVEGMYGTSSSA